MATAENENEAMTKPLIEGDVVHHSVLVATQTGNNVADRVAISTSLERRPKFGAIGERSISHSDTRIKLDDHGDAARRFGHRHRCLNHTKAVSP